MPEHYQLPNGMAIMPKSTFGGPKEHDYSTICTRQYMSYPLYKCQKTTTVIQEVSTTVKYRNGKGKQKTGKRLAIIMVD